MSRFLDGPAAGVALSLHRAPMMLRAVQTKSGEWDALDQLDDVATRDEAIVVYIAASPINRFHLLCRDRRGSGWYEEAEYRVLAEQPADVDVRSTPAWQAWCNANKDSLYEQHKGLLRAWYEVNRPPVKTTAVQ